MSVVPIDTDRRSKIYLRRALAYRDAARLIIDSRTELLDLYEPLLQIQCQSVEIGLKAFLLARGTSERRIEKLGHSLTQLFRASITNGLVVGFEDLRISLWMETVYSSHAMRYGPIGRSVSLQEPRRFHACSDRVLCQIAFHFGEGPPVTVPHPVDVHYLDMYIAIFSEMYRDHVERFEIDVGLRSKIAPNTTSE